MGNSTQTQNTTVGTTTDVSSATNNSEKINLNKESV